MFAAIETEKKQVKYDRGEEKLLRKLIFMQF
jgi:hypothetical protein